VFSVSFWIRCDRRVTEERAEYSSSQTTLNVSEFRSSKVGGQTASTFPTQKGRSVGTGR